MRRLSARQPPLFRIQRIGRNRQGGSGVSCSRLACKITAAYGRVKGGDKKPLPQPFQTLYTGKWIMYNNGPVTASSFSFQKRTAVQIKEAVAAFLLYFQSPLAVFLDFNSFLIIFIIFLYTSLQRYIPHLLYFLYILAQMDYPLPFV